MSEPSGPAREIPAGLPEVATRTTEGGGRTGSTSLWVTPALLVVACAALFYHLSRLNLDTIEARAINARVIGVQLVEHLELVAVSTVLVIVIAIPLGVLLTRPRMRRFAPIPLGLANIGQAVPTIGVLVLLAVTVGIGFQKAVIALVLVSALSVLRNTMVGIQGIDRSLIDAGRGIGLSKAAVLFRIELPLAVPVMLSGIRIALIFNVSSATLAAFTNAGGLGDLINTGIAVNRTPILLTGSVLTAVLALAIDWLAGLAERFLRPHGL
jgi:osmoprotectant transport system permease protein